MPCMPALKVVVMPNKLAVDEGNSALLSKTTTQTPSTHRWLKMSSLFYYCYSCFIVLVLFFVYSNNQHNTFISQVWVGGNHLLITGVLLPLLPNHKRTHPTPPFLSCRHFVPSFPFFSLKG